MTTEFWDWAVAAYARAGVAETCLMLQDDYDQCVPLLLWAAWRVDTGHDAGAEEAAKAAGIARAWADEVIAPLRQVRRRLKSAVSDGDDAVRLPLREKIKAEELASEHVLMTLLEQVASQKPYVKQEVGVALLVVSGAWGRGAAQGGLKDGLATLAEALTKG